MKRKTRVALLTNFLPPYRIPLLEQLEKEIGLLRVFVSVEMEADRNWPVFWGNLDVVINRTITKVRKFRNENGFIDHSYTHVPYDTIALLLRHKPDVVISSELGVRTFFAAIHRRIRPNSRLIIWATLSEHTEAMRGRMRGLIRRWLLRQTDAVFVNGASGKRYIRSMGFQKKSLYVIPYTADNQRFSGSPTRSPTACVQLLYTGQLTERKGLHTFLPQLGLWCESHSTRSVALKVVGSGPELWRLISIQCPPNLNIEFCGSLPFDDLPSVYHKADIYIYPTLADEWGLVVNEAMVAGLPVLGSCFSQAVEELVEDGINGWIFNPTDLHDTYHALDRALSTDARGLDAMRSLAIDAVSGISREAVAKEMSRAIRDVLS